MAQENPLDSLRDQLSIMLQSTPKLLILGIGENRMGDDGLGQYISFYLDEVISTPQVQVINGGIVPEERLSEIIAFSPDLLLLIDSVDSGKPSGSVNLYKDKQMMNYLPISSHSLPLPILVDRCKRKIPNLEVKLLGVQPYSLEFLDSYVLFKEQKYSLDDKEQNPNIPFYAFNLMDAMRELCDTLIRLFQEVIQSHYS